MTRRETRCPVCLMPGVAVRLDGTFAKHRSARGLGAPICAGIGRDAAACLALDAIESAEVARWLAVDQHARTVARIEERKAAAIRALDEEVAMLRDRVAVADVQVEALTLAALRASGWEMVEGDVFGERLWRDTHRPDAAPVETAEALRIARKDAGRR